MLSLVTACMDRERHLRASLPSWLQIPGLDEVVVVDWSSSSPLLDLASVDPRVRVVRAEGEPSWALSLAYNLGFAEIRGDFVLKCDADCSPSAGVMSYAPGERHFSAGHWRSSKPSTNGQCFLTRNQLDLTNGYSELIRTYGREDEDLYDRLAALGHERRVIPPETFDVTEHSDEERTAHQPGMPVNRLAVSVWEYLRRSLVYSEMHNWSVGKQMPWGPWFRRAVYETVSEGDRTKVVRRDASSEVRVPDAVEEEARLCGMRHALSQVCSVHPLVRDVLTEDACLSLLCQALSDRGRSGGAT